jgi:predicted ATP-dependent protease
MCSLLTGIPLQPGITGTGKIGENGRLLPVSSYEEKIWSSREAGYKTFLVPYESLRERKVLSQLEVIPVQNIKEAWPVATGTHAPQDSQDFGYNNWASALGFTIVQ